MARPIKKGLDYFPLDVDFLSDLKVRRIIKSCGKESVHILVALLANIYRDEGYYVLWDDDLAFLVADEVGTKEGTVEELIKKAIQVKFFDKDIFDKYSALTSKGIQNRYILATKERKIVELEFKYLLTNEVNRSNISIDRRNNSNNHGHNQQRKEKESKVKESKEQQEPAVRIYSFLEKNAFGRPFGNLMQDKIVSWLSDLQGKGLTMAEADAWMIEAVNDALVENARSFKYVEKIMVRRINANILTPDAIEGDRHRKSSNGYSNGYGKRNSEPKKLSWEFDLSNDDWDEYAKMTDEQKKERGWWDDRSAKNS